MHSTSGILFYLLFFVLMPFNGFSQSTHYDPIGSLDPLHSSSPSTPNVEAVPLVYPLTNAANHLDLNSSSTDGNVREHIGLEYSKNYDAAQLVLDSFQSPVPVDENSTASGSSAPAVYTPEPVHVDTLTTLPNARRDAIE